MNPKQGPQPVQFGQHGFTLRARRRARLRVQIRDGQADLGALGVQAQIVGLGPQRIAQAGQQARQQLKGLDAFALGTQLAAQRQRGLGALGQAAQRRRRRTPPLLRPGL